ncbi:MAG: polysaccharide deacetylase family protein [Anaerolineaceae bacterium]|nr:polysaccharide deacetylase family protein [Anaerolineaceae bacterium]
MKNRVVFHKLIFSILLLMIIGLSGCNILPGQSISIIQDTVQITNTPLQSTTGVITRTPFIPPTPSETPTILPSPTPSLTPTKFFLSSFEYNFKPNEVSPHTYQDTCEYLSNRWGVGKSEPGTIIVPVMYHSVRQSGRELQDNMQVSQEYFEYTMEYAKKMGFETITTQELVDFLYNNDPIPPLSMILIIDDRRLGVVDDHFMKYLDENDWTVTLAYITGIATANEWKEFARLNVNNQLDLQAHGFLHNGETYITEHTSVEVIEQELYSPIPVIKEQAGRRPQAFIWPGGNFTTESVLMAREAGYEVGFTVYSRGPLMYNWIPLGASEAKVNDPLLVLPRFWSNTAALYLERAVEISAEAIEFAHQNKENEYYWYQNYCSEYPPLAEIDEGVDRE